MDITKLSVAELKALAYDLLVQREQTENNLRIINAEVAKRSAPEGEVAKPKTKDAK